MTTLQIERLTKIYRGLVDTTALKDVSLTIEQGDFVAIEGPSGSGKTTLLNQLALLDTPTSGQYLIDDTDALNLNESERARMRSSTFSFIFQSFHLLDARNVLENVALSTLYRGIPARRRRELGREALSFVGLEHQASQKAATLSGGERQRVAIARAIASRTPILVADEPTGNLDQATGQQIIETLEALNAQGTTIILVTHDPSVAARAHRRIRVVDGIVREETPPITPTEVVPERSAHVSTGQNEDRPSTVRVTDALADAWNGLKSKISRTVALVISVGLGVGLALATAGLAQTARYQVSDIFDAQRNQRVGMTIMLNEHTAAEVASPQSIERLGKLSGMKQSLVTLNHGQHSISTQPMHDASATSMAFDVVGVIGGHLPQEMVTVETGGFPIENMTENAVFLGAHIAQELQLGPLAASPAVWIEGQPWMVAGIIKDAGLQLGLLRSVVMTEKAANMYGAAQYASAELKVAPGAAQQIAQQSAIAWVPSQAESVKVDAPPDPTTLRDDIESNLRTMLLTLTTVSLIAAVLSLMNSMTHAVFQRIGEFGLRRAIGAQRRHITGLVLSESLIIGILGGIVGTYGAVLAILMVALVRHWQPVLDPILIPAGIAGGIVVGFIGGIIATYQAGRIEPSDALRA